MDTQLAPFGAIQPAALAAQYVRMSTDHQQYSILNQLDTIGRYAVDHGLTIVRTFADAGKSGLTARNRQGLCELISEVTSGHANFRTILVYDVSRWGRFQDTDEAACYEFICRRCGIRVEYCAELFANDCSSMSSIMKGLKRVMAGEYSRELSVKVHAAQCRIARLGFKLGGQTGYGLRRIVVDAEGKRRGRLELGQQKFLNTDRVLLRPGTAKEQRMVRWIFDQVANHGQRPVGVAAELNRRGVSRPDGVPWTQYHVRYMISCEKYIGNMIYNRFSAKMRGPQVLNPPERWVRVDGAFPAMVDPTVFAKAQRALKRWSDPIDEEWALNKLRALLAKKGRLSMTLINSAQGMPSDHYYRKHFGGLAGTYRRIGYVQSPNRVTGWAERRSHMRLTRRGIVEWLAARGLQAEVAGQLSVQVKDGPRIAVLCACKRRRKRSSGWMAQQKLRPPPDWTLVVRFRSNVLDVLDYCLFEGGRRFIEVRSGPLPPTVKRRARQWEDLLEWLLERGRFAAAFAARVESDSELDEVPACA